MSFFEFAHLWQQLFFCQLKRNLSKFDKAWSGTIKAPEWNGQEWYRVEGKADSKVSEYNGIKKHFASIPDNLFDFFFNWGILWNAV